MIRQTLSDNMIIPEGVFERETVYAQSPFFKQKIKISLIQKMVKDYQDLRVSDPDRARDETDCRVLNSWIQTLWPELEEPEKADIMLSYVEPDELTGFYERREQQIEKFLDLMGTSDDEKAFFLRMDGKVEIPFRYSWVEGWSNLLGNVLTDMGVVMLISVLCRSSFAAILSALAVICVPGAVGEYLPAALQKIVDLIPLAGSSTDIFRTNVYHIFGRIIWSPWILITVPFVAGAACVPLCVRKWRKQSR